MRLEFIPLVVAQAVNVQNGINISFVTAQNMILGTLYHYH